MIKVALADDDAVLLKTFSEYFAKEMFINCIFTTTSLDDLIQNLSRGLHVDYLFLDIDFEGESSLGYIATIKKLRPQTEIIMFTQYTTDAHLFKAICAGASGFLPKTIEIKELKEYIKIILQDGAAITPQLAKRLMSHFRPPEVIEEESKKKLLSKLDAQILELIASGYSYQRIAEMTDISINGVRYHIKKIYKILHVHNKVDAIRVYKEKVTKGSDKIV